MPMMIGAFLYSAPIFTETFVKIAEKPNWVFISGFSCLVTNVILDYIFIEKLQWGMTGGAVATLCACLVGFVALFPNIKMKKPKKFIQIYLSDIKIYFITVVRRCFHW